MIPSPRIGLMTATYSLNGDTSHDSGTWVDFATHSLANSEWYEFTTDFVATGTTTTVGVNVWRDTGNHRIDDLSLVDLTTPALDWSLY